MGSAPLLTKPSPVAGMAAGAAKDVCQIAPSCSLVAREPTTAFRGVCWDNISTYDLTDPSENMTKDNPLRCTAF